MSVMMKQFDGHGLLARLIPFFQSSRVLRRAMRRWLRNRDFTILSGVGTGLKFNAAFSNPAYALGTNEQPVQAILAEHLQNGSVFYDIGANVGFFTVIGAKLVGPDGRVHAFEPVPENVACIRHNIAINNFRNVQVWQNAVSDISGPGELQLAHYSGGSALATVAPPPDLKGLISVDLVTVDELVQQQEVKPPTVVKIDVEGAEIQVLRGMRQTIKRYRPVLLYEIDDNDATSFHQKQSACDNFIKGHNYRLTRLGDSYPDINWKVGHFIAVPQ